VGMQIQPVSISPSESDLSPLTGGGIYLELQLMHKGSATV